MAGRKQDKPFEQPRDENGRFLPMKDWTKADQRRYRKALKNGEFKKKAKKSRETKGRKRAMKPNPLVVRGMPSPGQVEIAYEYPHGRGGHFKPLSDYTPDELRDHRVARHLGLLARGPRAPKEPKPSRRAATRVVPASRVEALGQFGGDFAEIVREIRELRRLIEVRQGVSARSSMTGGSEPVNDICEHCPPEFPDLSRRLRRIEEATGLIPARNPRKVRLVNPGDSKLDDIVEFAKEHPLLALAGIGAIIAISIAVYKGVQHFLLSRQGVRIAGGTITYPGEAPYQMTSDDMVWLARAAYSEVNPRPTGWDSADRQRGAAGVLYALANHFMAVGEKRPIFGTLGNFARNYCQPLSPRWATADASGCLQSPAMCSIERLAHRANMRSLTWGQIPTQLQSIVQSFSAGLLSNPVGGRTDWIQRGLGVASHFGAPLTIAGNTFWRHGQTRGAQVA